MAKERRYIIDSEIFLEAWYRAVSRKPEPLSMAEFIAVLKLACDKDERNAGLTREWTEAQIKSKMDYYNRSWGLKIVKPKMSKSNTIGARQERRDKYTRLFKEGGYAEEK